MSSVTVKAIVADWLTAHGADGLCSGDCGCGLDDLCPCVDPQADCVPAVLRPCRTPDDCMWCKPGRAERHYYPMEAGK